MRPLLPKRERSVKDQTYRRCRLAYRTGCVPPTFYKSARR